MSYAEVVRFISVQPFPLQRHHLSLSLSPFFSYPLVCFSNLFLSYSLNPPPLSIPPSFFPYFISSALPCFFIQFPLFSPPFSSHLLFSDSENCTLLSSFRPRSFFENDRAKHRYFCPTSLFRWNFRCTTGLR